MKRNGPDHGYRRSPDPGTQCRRGREKVKIDIKDLSFFYGDHKSLKNISLPLMERKVTAFIGPSGCGKSTLLRAINRIFELYPASAPRARS